MLSPPPTLLGTVTDIFRIPSLQTRKTRQLAPTRPLTSWYDFVFDLFHAGLRLRMIGGGSPRPIAHRYALHFGDFQAAPALRITLWWSAAFTGELIAEDHLLATGSANGMDAKFSRVSIVETKDMLTVLHGVQNRIVRCASQFPLPFKWDQKCLIEDGVSQLGMAPKWMNDHACMVRLYRMRVTGRGLVLTSQTS